MEFFDGEDRLRSFASKKAKTVFAFLLLSPGRLFERLSLAQRFWAQSTDTRARKALNTELWRIASGLKEQGLDPNRLLVRDQESVGYRDRPEVWVDVSSYEAALRPLPGFSPEACSNEEIGPIVDAVSLYRGNLLEGIFDDWCLVRRERLLSQQSYALQFLVKFYMHRRDWQSALSYGNQLIELDPLMEHAHRALMRCHYLMGNRPAAIRQYTECKERLRDELGVSPMEETERVYQTMLVRTPVPDINLPQASIRSTSSPVENLDRAIAGISAATGWLKDAREQLKLDD